MRKKKILIGLVCILAFSLAFGVFSSLSWGAQKPIVIRYAHGDPPNPVKSSAHADAVLFKSYVEDHSGGRIKVEIYPACELGSEREMLEGVQMGSIQITNVSEGTVGIFFPEILATAIPYAFRTYNEAWYTLDSPFMRKLMEEMRKKTGIRCLDVNQNGFRNFSNDVRPIHTPADLKGLKIRTMEHRGHMKMVEALGAHPVPIAWGELFGIKSYINKNMDEILRMVKGFQIADKERVAIPANWPENELIKDEVIIPPPTDEESAKRRKGEYECFDWWFCHKKL